MDQRQNYNSVKCSNCGTIYPDECKFCPQCGKERNSTEARPTNSAQRDDTEARPLESMKSSSESVQPAESMKWYKFVIWVQLFLSAFMNLGNGIRYMTGIIYGDSASMVYLMFKSLKTLDVFMGVLCIAAAVLAIIARQSLAHFKKNGPLLYYVCCGAGIVYNLIYLFGLSAVGVLSAVGSQVASELGSYIAGYSVMLAVNIMYFKKRMHLFVN